MFKHTTPALCERICHIMLFVSASSLIPPLPSYSELLHTPHRAVFTSCVHLGHEDRIILHYVGWPPWRNSLSLRIVRNHNIWELILSSERTKTFYITFEHRSGSRCDQLDWHRSSDPRLSGGGPRCFPGHKESFCYQGQKRWSITRLAVSPSTQLSRLDE
jgi:hypothetical protein